jgi:hypothetical protein
MAWGVPKIGTRAEVASGNLTLTEPAGIAAGDVMIACIAYRSNAAFTVPGDWNLVATQQSSGDLDATNGIASGLMMWAVRGGSAPTLTFNRTAGDVAHGLIIAYSGGHTSPFNAGSAVTEASATSTTIAPNIASVVSGELAVAMVSAGDNLNTTVFNANALIQTNSGAGTDTTTAPTSDTWFRRFNLGTATGADSGLAIADGVANGSGTLTSPQASVSAAARHVMIVGVFKPAAAVPRVPKVIPMTFQPYLAQ